MEQKCRICLDFQPSLSDFREFAETYKFVTGFDVVPHSQPQLICDNCQESLLFCHDFKLKCERTEALLNGDLGVKVEEGHDFEAPGDFEITDDSKYDITFDLLQYSCEICSTTFASINSLRTHCRKLHKGQEGHSCIQCSKKFFHVAELDRHGRVCTKPVKRERQRGSKKSSEKSICCHCGKIMASHYLDRHIQDVHERSGASPEYLCDLCGDKCRTKVGILAHMKRRHMKTVYDCHFCQETFPSYGIRRTHEVRFHTFNFKYHCSVCDHKFIARRDLLKHRVTHTGEKNFRCEICGLHVSRRSVLELHKATHSDSRPFPCPTCSAAFKTRKALNQHSNIHKERNYECPVCNQKFLVNQAMRQHVSKRHPEFQLPPPGTLMNKNALKRLTEVSEKYNVKLEELLTRKLPKTDVSEDQTIVVKTDPASIALDMPPVTAITHLQPPIVIQTTVFTDIQ